MFIRVILVACVIVGSMSCRHAKLSSDDCPTNLRNHCKCHRVDLHNVVCCNLDSALIKHPFNFMEAQACANLQSNLTTHLFIKNSSIDVLDADVFTRNWSTVVSLTVSNSQIGKIDGSFGGDLSCVNLSGNSLTDVSNSAFVNLPKLELLDLSKNNLTKLPHLVPTLHPELYLDISGNSGVWCGSVKDLMVGFKNTSTNLQFFNYNDSFCLSSWSFHWFNSTEVVPLGQVETLIGLEQECPKGPNYTCQCRSSRFDYPPRFAVKVDCSGQQLSSLPLRLPPYTVLLNVSNNNITILDPLSVDESYHDVREFYADNNNIDSINVLEGSRFIQSFDILSLKGNKLKTIPTYILSDTFDRNLHPRHVKLGDNRLHCDCNTAQILKLWLLTNRDHIPDYNEVLCEQDLKKVIYLDPNKLCVYQKDWTDYIYYIITAEVILLIILVSKVSYDYWVFKTAGYLPWPASKMPKLPCDWVCES